MIQVIVYDFRICYCVECPIAYQKVAVYFADIYDLSPYVLGGEMSEPCLNDNNYFRV